MQPPVSSESGTKAATSPQLLRQINAAAVIEFALTHEAFSATEIMTAIGLTRSTVLGICDELVITGWIVELEDARAAGTYAKGRPARRYRLNEDAGSVLAVDAGLNRVTARLANLRGVPLSEISRDFTSDSSAARQREVERIVAHVLRAANARRPLVTVIAVPAPVDEAGDSPEGDDGFWRRMNPGFTHLLAGLAPVFVENNANLAALAEQTLGAGRGARSFAVLLSNEGFGAGIVLDGRLLRGSHGGAGELRLLSLVKGVESADGLAQVARQWGSEVITRGKVLPGTPLARHSAETLTASEVLDAAAKGDPVATRIVTRLGGRLARVAEVLVSLLDVERIIIAGEVSIGSGQVIQRATETLQKSFYPPLPDILPSALGADIVVLGAVEYGLGLIRSDPMAFTPNGADLAGIEAQDEHSAASEDEGQQSAELLTT